MNTRDEKAIREFLTIMHRVAPAEIRAAMKKLSAALDALPPPRKPGSPCNWSNEWRTALVIFVERRVYRETFKRLLETGTGPGKREIDAIRTDALKQSLKRMFPFRSRTVAAARQQFHESRKQLRKVDRPGESLTWIYTALDLEATYEQFKHLGADYPLRITQIRPDYRAMPDWIWSKLAKSGRLLMQDVPKIN